MPWYFQVAIALAVLMFLAPFVVRVCGWWYEFVEEKLDNIEHWFEKKEK